MITKHIPGISGAKTNSIASTSVAQGAELHLRGTYSPVAGNSKQTIGGKDYNPIHRIKDASGEEYLVESIYPIDLQKNRHAANGTLTNKNGTIYAVRVLGSDEAARVRQALGLSE